MKTLKSILIILSFSFCFTGCSKSDDDTSFIESTPQYPMKYLIENGNMTLNNTKVNSAVTFELGYKFKSFKNGKIEALGVRVPDNGEYRVTLWNMDTEEILTTKYIVSSSGLLSFDDVEPISITSGTTYFVSVNTNDYYSFNNSGNNIFPAESEDIFIMGYGSYYGSSQGLPTQFSNTSYLGMVDFKFIAYN